MAPLEVMEKAGMKAGDQAEHPTSHPAMFGDLGMKTQRVPGTSEMKLSHRKSFCSGKSFPQAQQHPKHPSRVRSLCGCEILRLAGAEDSEHEKSGDGFKNENGMARAFQ